MKLSEKSERLKVVAGEEARRLGHRYVGTEHLLLAVSHDENEKVCEILVELGLDPADLRSQVDAFVIKSGVPKTDEDIPMSPRAEAAFERSLVEAGQLECPAAEPEHVLLAMAEDEDGVAARVLEVFGIDYASIRRFLI